MFDILPTFCTFFAQNLLFSALFLTSYLPNPLIPPTFASNYTLTSKKYIHLIPKTKLHPHTPKNYPLPLLPYSPPPPLPPTHPSSPLFNIRTNKYYKWKQRNHIKNSIISRWLVCENIIRMRLLVIFAMRQSVFYTIIWFSIL